MELLEREAPLESLAASLRQAAAGTGQVALLYGESGIGKTALIERFLATHRPNVRVLLGRCDSLFTPRPLGPLHDIARQTDGTLLQLVQSASSSLAMFGALLQELDAVDKPTVLVFEDVHWADEATLDLLKYVGRRVRATRTLVILTYRDDELDGGHLLWSLLGHLPADEVRRVGLEPLTPEAVADLAQRAGRPAEHVHAQTHGNPFYVTELLASPPGSIPATVRDATMARAMRLSPAARETLDFCSTVPNRIEPWLLGDSLSKHIDECVSSGLIVQQDGMLSFRHELARRAVERALPPNRLQSLHARVLRRLEKRGSASIATARLVHHAAKAADDAAVRRYAPEAARQASVLGAHRQAAAQYQTALDHTPADDIEARATLLEGRAYECGLFDRVEEAVAAREAALSLRRQQGNLLKAGDNLRWLSRLVWFSGCGEDARDLARQAIEMLEPLPPGAELAMAYSNTAQLHMLAEDVEGAAAWGGRALQLAERLDLTETLVHALNNVGAAEFVRGLPGGRARIERSLELALANELHDHVARAYTNLAYQPLSKRDYADAERRLVEGLAYTRARDLDAWTPYLLALRARAHFEQGRWQEADDDSGEALRAAPSAITRAIAVIVRACVHLRRGDPGAPALLDEARDLALPTGEIMRIGPVAAARAEAAWLAGDNERVRAEAQAAYGLALQRPESWRLGELSLWLWRAGALDRPPDGIAPPYQLEIAGDWPSAAGAWEAIGCPYEQALALAGGDQPAQLQALDILVRLGATPAAGLVRQALRSQGVRSIPRGPRAATMGNPLGLTARQVDILRLLAANMSSKEIAARLRLSPKTVDHHVGAILAKLGVSTRRQAAAHGVAQALLAKDRESSGQTG